MFIDFREEGGERVRERDIDVREKHQMVASCMCPDQGSNPQPRYVLQLGIELATFWCSGRCSNQPSYPARAVSCVLLP